MLAQRFLKHRTLCWSILDIKLSFLPCVCWIFAEFAQYFVVFAMFLRHFWWILDSGENCVRSVLLHFRWFFRGCWPTLARALSVPGRSLVLGCQKLHCRGLRTSVRSAQICIFLVFLAFFWVFPKRFEHGRFSCKGGRDMAGKIPTTFAVSCSRPTALRASQPSLLSFSSLSTFLLQFFPFSQCFLQFFIFSPFSFLPSFFFPFFFHRLPVIFHHFLQFHAFSRVFWSKRRVSM